MSSSETPYCHLQPDCGRFSQTNQNHFLAIIFVLFLLLAFTGMQPFAERTGYPELSETGGGNLLRQVLYLFFALAIVGTARHKRLVGWFILPWPALLVFGWCLITLLWSPVPGIGFRRLGLTVIVAMTVYSAVMIFGEKRIIELLFLTLIASIIASLLSGLVITNAIHQHGEADLALVGTWRGIFTHKNGAGSMAAICILIGYFFWGTRDFNWRIPGRWWRVMAVGAGATLLLLSYSKTSIGLVLPALVLGILFRRLSEVRSGRTLLAFWLAFLIIGAGTILLAMMDTITQIALEPTAFTGRGSLWVALLALVAANPIGGVGFGSIFATGYETPLFSIATGWSLHTGSGHNGYLEMLASTGVVGLILSVAVFIVIPFRQIFNASALEPRLGGMLAALLSFAALHNLMESSLLYRDTSVWLMMLIVWAIADRVSQR